MKVIALTGSIGMGKTTAASLFRRRGVPVYDADRAVHKLSEKGGRAVPAIARAFPDAVKDGAVDRKALGALVFNNPKALKKLESILHPLVAEERTEFLRRQQARRRPVVVLDIPLLFETGCEGEVDAILLVTAPEAVQKGRLAERPGMTDDKLAAIIAKQMPDAEKRHRADIIFDTSFGHDAAARQVRELIDAIRGGRLKARHHA